MDKDEKIKELEAEIQKLKRVVMSLAQTLVGVLGD